MTVVDRSCQYMFVLDLRSGRFKSVLSLYFETLKDSSKMISIVSSLPILFGFIQTDKNECKVSVSVFV